MPPDQGPGQEQQPRPSFIPVLPRELLERFRNELNLDYYNSPVRIGKTPNQLITDLALDTFNSLAALGGRNLYKLFTRR